MTTTDRLRKAVEAALPDGFYVIDPMHGKIADIDCSLRALVLAAVLPIVEELEEVQAEVKRLRAVLEWIVDRSPTHAWQGQLAGCALHGNWLAVRAAGVALPEPPSPPAGKRRA